MRPSTSAQTPSSRTQQTQYGDNALSVLLANKAVTRNKAAVGLAHTTAFIGDHCCTLLKLGQEPATTKVIRVPVPTSTSHFWVLILQVLAGTQVIQVLPATGTTQLFSAISTPGNGKYSSRFQLQLLLVLTSFSAPSAPGTQVIFCFRY